MSSDKRLYETTFIVNASLEDTQIESTVGHVGEVITRNGGLIIATNRWGRKRLAYPIEKKNNGYYVNIEFTAPQTVNAQLERSYTLDENILRFLTIQVDKRAIQARRIAAAAAAAAPPVAPAAPVPAAAPPAPAAAPAAEAPKPTPAREPLFTDDAPAAKPARS